MHKFIIGDILVQREYETYFKYDIFLVVKNPNHVELYELFSMADGIMTFHSTNWLEKYYECLNLNSV